MTKPDLHLTIDEKRAVVQEAYAELIDLLRLAERAAPCWRGEHVPDGLRGFVALSGDGKTAISMHVVECSRCGGLVRLKLSDKTPEKVL